MPRYRITIRDSKTPRSDKTSLIYSRTDDAAVTWAKEWLTYARITRPEFEAYNEWEVSIRQAPDFQPRTVASGAIRARA